MNKEKVCRRLCLSGLLLLLSAFVSTGLRAQVKKPSQTVSIRTISVVTEPNAVVWIDDVRYGKTDESGRLTIKTVAGAHKLRVRANGFKEISQPLTAAQKGDVKIALVKTADPAELAYQKAEGLTASDREAAAAAYRKAVELRPAYPEAYVGLARVLMEAGDLDSAQKAIGGARKLRPAYAEASAVEGRIYKEYGEEAKAIASFKRAITEGKGFQPEAYTGLGLLYKEKAEGDSGSDLDQETANYTEAAKNLKVALKQLSGAPDTVVIYQLLGLVYERMKKYQDAIDLYEEFLRIFPNSGDSEAVRSFIVQLKKQMAEQE